MGRPMIERVRVECAVCSEPTERTRTQVEKSKTNRFFCSSACRDQTNLKPHTGRWKPCEQCGADVYVRPHAEAVGKGRFCNKSCFDAWQARNSVTRECAHCGGSFRLSPSQAALPGRAGQFCSKKCESVAKIKRPLDRTHNGKPARLDEHGYVWVWEPDHAASKPYKGWLTEHRLVAEQIIGRPLTSDDEVHHINRFKDDNRPENLEVLDGLTHARYTAGQRQSDKELLAEYIKRFGPLNMEESA